MCAEGFSILGSKLINHMWRDWSATARKSNPPKGESPSKFPPGKKQILGSLVKVTKAVTLALSTVWTLPKTSRASPESRMSFNIFHLRAAALAWSVSRSERIRLEASRITSHAQNISINLSAVTSSKATREDLAENYINREAIYQSSLIDRGEPWLWTLSTTVRRNKNRRCNPYSRKESPEANGPAMHSFATSTGPKIRTTHRFENVWWEPLAQKTSLMTLQVHLFIGSETM